MQILRSEAYKKVEKIRNFADLLDYVTNKFGTNTAFRFREQAGGEIQERSFNNFYDDVKTLSFSIFKYSQKWQAEMRKNEPINNKLLDCPKIVILGDNSYYWRQSYLAASLNETVVVPIDRLLKYNELKGLIDRCQPTILFYSAAYHDKAQQILEESDSLQLIVCMQAQNLHSNFADYPFISANDLIKEYERAKFFQSKKAILFEDFCLFGASLKNPTCELAFGNLKIDENAPSILLFTSGTTENAKGVVLSQKNICSDMVSIASVIDFSPGMTAVSLLPLHHTFENTCGFLMMLFVGACVADIDGLRHIAKNIQEYKPDIIIAVPLIFENFYSKIIQAVKKRGQSKKFLRAIKLSKQMRKFGIDLRKRFFSPIINQFGGNLKYGIVGAAPTRTDLIHFFESIGIRILEGYGLSETAPVVAGCNMKVFVPGTCGQAIADVEVAIDSDKKGGTGEILVRGENVMLGYYKEDGSLDRSIIDENGWFHTGDLGYIDPKTECLKINGRIKSMIVLENGKKVFPEEIEDLLKSSPYVKDALVFADDRNNSKIQICASLVLDLPKIEEDNEKPNDKQAIEKHLSDLVTEINQQLPNFKSIVYYFYSFDEMIKTTTLKVKRPLETSAIKEAFLQKNLDVKAVSGGYFSKNGVASPLDK